MQLHKSHYIQYILFTKLKAVGSGKAGKALGLTRFFLSL